MSIYIIHSALIILMLSISACSNNSTQSSTTNKPTNPPPTQTASESATKISQELEELKPTIDQFNYNQRIPTF